MLNGVGWAQGTVGLGLPDLLLSGLRGAEAPHNIPYTFIRLATVVFESLRPRSPRLLGSSLLFLEGAPSLPGQVTCALPGPSPHQS